MDVTIDSIRDARAAFGDVVRRTPLLRSTTLGADVWLKAENLQHTGSFKVRGAMNRIAALTADERARGVVAASAGNHAQGVAVAARAHGVRATIVMPRTTPLAKIEATRDYGAEIVLAGDSYDEAHEAATRLRDERGLIEIPAYDDPLVVAGQGTAGLEVVEDLADLDVVVVPVGGGGLAAGVAIAVKMLRPRSKVVGVQVEAAPGIARSIASGRIEHVPPQPTVAEGIAVGGPGAVTFPVLQRCVDDVVIVSDDEIVEAMVLLLERSKVVVEGAGAAGVAALISGKIEHGGVRIAVVLSGGNVDINMLARVVEHGLTRAGRYFTITVSIDDKPGQLALISRTIADAGANVLSVAHHRFGIDLPVGRVNAVLLLEVRNRAHAGEVASAMEGAGFRRTGETAFEPASWSRGPRGRG